MQLGASVLGAVASSSLFESNLKSQRSVNVKGTPCYY